MEEHNNQLQSVAEPLKGWIMIILTLAFISLYIAALFGLIEPLKDSSIINRLEPIIFVIIGYYFGRLPAQATENTLKNEIKRQTQKTDAAQQIKEKVQQEREVLEEKIKNAKITLAAQTTDSVTGRAKSAASSLKNDDNANQAVESAIRILDS